MLVKLSSDYFLDTLRGYIVNVRNNNILVDLSNVFITGPSQNIELKISPKHYIWDSYKTHKILILYQPKTANSSDKIYFIFLQDNNNQFTINHISISPILSGELTNKTVLSYSLIPLGAKEVKYGNTLYYSYVFYIKAVCSNNEVYGNIYSVIIETNNNNVSLSYQQILKLDNNQLVGTYDIIVNPQDATSNVIIFTKSTENDIIGMFRNLFQYYQQEYYVLEEAQNTINIRKFSIGYEFIKIISVFRHIFYVSDNGIVWTKNPQEIDNFKNQLLSTFNVYENKVDKIILVPTVNSNTNNVYVLKNVFSTIELDTTNNINYVALDSVLSYSDFVNSTSNGNWFVLSSLINKNSGNNSFYKLYDKFLEISFQDSIPLNYGAYLTILQVQELNNTNSKNYIILDKDVYFINKNSKIFVKLKEFVDRIIFVFHNPNDYIEPPLNATVYNNYNDTQKSRIIDNILNANDFKDYIVLKVILEDKAVLTEIRFNQDYFTSYDRVVDDYIYINLSRVPEGYKRYYMFDKANYKEYQKLDNVPLVYDYNNATAEISYNLTHPNSAIILDAFTQGYNIFTQRMFNSNNIIDETDLRDGVDNFDIQSNEKYLVNFNYSNYTMKIKNVVLKLSSGNVVKTLVFKNDYDLLDGTGNSIGHINDITDYRDFYIKIPDISTYSYDTLSIVFEYVVYGIANSNSYQYKTNSLSQQIFKYNVVEKEFGSIKDLYKPTYFKRIYKILDNGNLYVFNNSPLYVNKPYKYVCLFPQSYLYLSKFITNVIPLFVIFKKNNIFYYYVNNFESTSKYVYDKNLKCVVNNIQDLNILQGSASIVENIDYGVYSLKPQSQNLLINILPYNNYDDKKILRNFYLRFNLPRVNGQNSFIEISKNNAQNTINIVDIKPDGQNITLNLLNFKKYSLKGKIVNNLQQNTISNISYKQFNDIEVSLQQFSFKSSFIAEEINQELTSNNNYWALLNSNYEFYAINNIENFANNVNNKFWILSIKINDYETNFIVFENLIEYLISSKLFLKYTLTQNNNDEELITLENVSNFNDILLFNDRNVVNNIYNNNNNLVYNVSRLDIDNDLGYLEFEADGVYINNFVVPYIVLGALSIWSTNKLDIYNVFNQNDLLFKRIYLQLDLNARIFKILKLSDSYEYVYLGYSYTNASRYLSDYTREKKVFYKLFSQ